MLIVILLAVLWLALIFLTVRALKRNPRPLLRLCRGLEPRRYRPAGRSGRRLRYRWMGEAAAAAAVPTGERAFEASPAPRRPKRAPAFAIVMAVNAVLVAVIAGLLLRDFVPRPGTDPSLVSSSSEASSPAQSEGSSQPEAEPTTAPEPTPEPAPAANEADPLQPECSLYDGSDYAAGTWMKVHLNEAEACESATLTVSISDLGTGEELWHAEEQVSRDDDIEYCLEEPNNYVITAYATNAAGVQSEYLTLTIKIYAS